MEGGGDEKVGGRRIERKGGRKEKEENKEKDQQQGEQRKKTESEGNRKQQSNGERRGRERDGEEGKRRERGKKTGKGERDGGGIQECRNPRIQPPETIARNPRREHEQCEGVAAPCRNTSRAARCITHHAAPFGLMYQRPFPSPPRAQSRDFTPARRAHSAASAAHGRSSLGRLSDRCRRKRRPPRSRHPDRRRCGRRARRPSCRRAARRRRCESRKWRS